MKAIELMGVLERKNIRFEFHIEDNEELKKKLKVIFVPFISPTEMKEIVENLQEEEWGINNGLYVFFETNQ